VDNQFNSNSYISSGQPLFELVAKRN